MALTTCPDCSTQVSDQAPTCPQCGRGFAAIAATAAAIEAEAARVKRQQARILVGVAALILGAMAAAFSDRIPSPPAPAIVVARAPAAIDYCAKWRSTTKEGADFQRVAMGENLRLMDGAKIDQRCLGRQVEPLVRWANRTCSVESITIDQQMFAGLLVSEARKRCP